jgi:hypothetical protein
MHYIYMVCPYETHVYIVFMTHDIVFVMYGIHPLLGGSLVTTAYHVLRLRMEETHSKNGVELQIYIE